MKKELLNEINRLKQIMGVKPLLTEGLATLGIDLLDWFSTKATKVFDEVPGLLDNFGNPIKKTFYQIADLRIPEETYEIFKKLCNGTETFNNLISTGRKDVVNMILDIMEKSNDILTKEYDELINAERAINPSHTEDAILRAIKKRLDNGEKLEDIMLEMTGYNEFAAMVLSRKFGQKLANLSEEVTTFKGNTFDDLRSAIQRRWANALQNVDDIDKPLRRSIVEWLGKKGLGQRLSVILAQMIQKAPSRYDNVIDEMVSKWEEVFSKILNDKNYIKSIDPNMFRSINVDIDALGMEMSDEIRKFLLGEIRKVDFNLPGGSRKLTEQEINSIENALNDNKVFDNFIPNDIKTNNWLKEKFFKSYYSRFFTQNGKINRFFWWALTGTARNGKEWSIALRGKQGFTDYFGAYVNSVISITVVCKGVLPALLGLGYFAANVISELGQTTEGKTAGEEFYKSMGEAYKNAWLPYDSMTKNIINLFFPIHVPASQFYDLIATNTEKFLNGVYSDDINWDDVLSDVKGLEDYKNISAEEWKKIEDFLKNSGRDMNDVINMDMNQVNEDLKTVESISLEDTTTWEPGFMAWTRLRLLTDATFSTETGMGKAKNPVNGQFKTYEIQPSNKTFRERENR